MEYGMAFRWFHICIPDNLTLVDEHGKVVDEFGYSKTYLSPDLIINNFTMFCRGMMKQPQRMGKVGYTDEVCHNYFFDITVENTVLICKL